MNNLNLICIQVLESNTFWGEFELCQIKPSRSIYTFKNIKQFMGFFEAEKKKEHQLKAIVPERSET